MTRAIRNEASANDLLAATIIRTTKDADRFGMTAYDRTGRNALSHGPIRTRKPVASLTMGQRVARVLSAWL